MGLNEKFFKSASDTPVVAADNFAPVIYNGNNTTQSITSLNFKPDLIWLKGRNNGNIHILTDSIRGTNSQLTSNNTGAQTAGAANVTSFNSNGFSLGDAGNTNTSGQTYVAWCWKAGEAAVQNNDGTIQGANCLVSANVAGGFSIVKYTGNGTAGATVGHGLTSLTPSLIIWKNISATSNWLVYSPLIGNDSQFLYLNLTNQEQTSGSQNEYPTYKTDPTSTLVTVNGAGSSNNINISGENTIMYCFADVAGYQKVGSYAGSNSNLQVNTGFQPRFLMLKNIDVARPWIMIDSLRTGYLEANSSGAESDTVSNYVSFNSTGFLLVGGTGSYINESGYNWLYLAIA